MDKTSIQPPVQAMDDASGERIWSVGTLRYTKAGITMLFFWLMWNDFCLVLKGSVPGLTPILMKDLGATNAQIALYISTLGGMFNILINPFVSTWSDNHRSPHGRRRPFLFFAAPFCALFLCAIPFMPHLASLLGLRTVSGVVMLVGLSFICFSVFNSVIAAIFSYYYWDVVPADLLGRFNSIAKIVTTAASFLWSFFIFGLAEKHMQAIFVAISAFFLVVYTVSLWKVKEGDYPPPVVREKGPWLAPLRRYAVECFGQSYYRWIFAAFVVFQTGNFSNMYQIFYFRETLHMSLDTIGKMCSWPTLLIVLIAYPAGSFVDRLNPIRLVSPALLACGLVNMGAFFFLRGPWSLLICAGLGAIATFVYGLSVGILNVTVFPREKIGQFCSATQISCSITAFCMSYPLGKFFDYIKNYRYTFMWSSCFQFLAALMFIKVYRNWKRMGGSPPVPDAV